MALTTVCPACNTRFKVVPDQLQLHHGLVRCGACDHVFDANSRLESLPLPIEPSADDVGTNNGAYRTGDHPQSWINKPAVKALTSNASDASDGGALKNNWAHTLSNQGALNTMAGHARAAPTADANIISSPALSDEMGSKASQVADQAASKQTQPFKQIEPLKRRNIKHSLAALDEDEKKATLKRPRSPAVAADPSIAIDWSKTLSAAGITLCVMAASLVLLQIAIAARYPIADRVTQAKPWLKQVCIPIGCSVEPAPWLSPLNLDALSLSKINTATSASDAQAYRMQATVRNNSQLTVKTPNIELTISNLQGTPIARKVLSAVQLGAGATLDPNSDWQIDSALQLDPQTVGYTARLVY